MALHLSGPSLLPDIEGEKTHPRNPDPPPKPYGVDPNYFLRTNFAGYPSPASQLWWTSSGDGSLGAGPKSRQRRQTGPLSCANGPPANCSEIGLYPWKL